MSDVAERVKKIVTEQLGVKEEVTNEASFVDDLGADSLDTVELVMALEEEFECEIPDEDAEMATSPTSLGGFASAKALSRRNDEPLLASRPFDQDRDGFVLSDGAGVLVLEELEHARRRGATIYAELIGFGMSADAYHMTQPPADGEGAARCMQHALRDAQINPADIDYINAHGTSTPAGDVAETQAVKTVLGEHAYRVAVSSTKSMTGHMLGAAGGIEAIFSVLALKEQVAPPTINLDHPDPQCDLDYIPHHAREMALKIVMSNSFGFGGTNGTLIFKRYD